ncbi:MAG: nitroreductase family protein [Gammaproteobacteria bacterium]|nr:nitroreductase family protein [Gammaproteobacteria bacterium]
MSKSSNPLLNMTEALGHVEFQEGRPNESFESTSLPGFKLALEGRRAIREYDHQPIPENIMRDCLSDATLAPSSSNLQTYELYWVRDPDKKELLAQACLGQPASTSAGELIVIVARVDLWKINLEKVIDIMTQGGANPLPGPVDDYYHKIVPMIMKNDVFGINNLIRRAIYWFKGQSEPTIRTPVNQCDHRIYGHIQSSLVAQTLMLSLAAHGYESCPMGGMDKLRIGKMLNLPRKAEVSMVIAAGRGKPEGLYGSRVRLPESDLVKVV